MTTRLEKDDDYEELTLVDGDAGRQVVFVRHGRIGKAPHKTVRHPFVVRFDGERMLCKRVVELLSFGWTVTEASRDPQVDDEPRDPMFEGELADEPGNADVALVYGDWLTEEGHPRGELVAVQHRLVQAPDDPALREAEERLRTELLGALVDAAPDDRGSGVDVTWEHGFIRKARIDGGHDRRESEALLLQILRNPSARFLRELEIGCHYWGDQNNELMARVLIHGGYRPPLRRLVLADFDDTKIDCIDISRAPLGDLTGLGQAFPRLEDVTLKGCGWALLGDLWLPNARRFAFRTSTLVKSTLAAILAAPWPALEELEIWLGTKEYGANCEVPDVRPLFERARFPRLRSLRFMNAEITDEVLPDLLASDLLPRLERLDFALGTLSDDGARRLVGAKDALAHLRAIGVFDNALTPAGLAMLVASGLAIDDEPCADGAREKRQKERRYVTVSE